MTKKMLESLTDIDYVATDDKVLLRTKAIYWQM